MSVISWTGSVLHRLTGRGGAVAVVALGIAFGMTQGAFAATVGHEHEDGVDWVNGAGSAETGPEGAYVTIDEAGLDAIYAQAGVDVRVMSSSTRDLEKAIEATAFRKDLYYRLNVVPLSVPSLAERRDDIPALVEYFSE